MRWMEISLTLDGELAEAVADVLSRFAPGKVVVESTMIADQPDAEGAPTGPVRVVAYLPVDEKLGETRAAIEQALWHLGVISPLPKAEWRIVEEENWAEAWKRNYRPIPIGKRLIIVPAWMENPRPDRTPIFIDPSTAFGTGTHPTTQMCLQEVERLVRGGELVLDVGCGSGILSIAALKLGAAAAFGVDTDPQAVEVARENARRNSVADRLRLAVGSVDAIRRADESLRRAPIVLANILAPILVRLLDEEGLADLLAPHGHLVLSGILDYQAEDVLSAAHRAGLTLTNRLQQKDWVTLTLSSPRG